MTDLLVYVSDCVINGCVFLLGVAVFYQAIRTD